MKIIVALFLAIFAVQAAPTLQFRGTQPLSKHTAITFGPSPLTAAPGDKVSVFVDMVPNPGVHIYAPGAKDYVEVKVTLKPQADAKAGKLTYPKSEMVRFPALDQTLPVYQKAFRLTQDVTLARSVKPGSTVTLTGTLEFQACDDNVCFIPESVPASWTVSVK